MKESPITTPDPCIPPTARRRESTARHYATPRLVVHGDATSLTEDVTGRGIDGPIS